MFSIGWRAPIQHWHVEVSEADQARRYVVLDKALAEQEARYEGNPPGDQPAGRIVKVVACWNRCLGSRS